MTELIYPRTQILYATQRWPLLVLFCLTGAFFGWGISWLYPSSIRATQELYVGLNVNAGQPDSTSIIDSAAPRFTNADDYKNWQMANLNTLVYMDELIDQTLLQLRTIDSYWNDINQRQLRKSLQVYWRNAGKWRLVAIDVDRFHAAQAVTVWQDTILQRVHQAVGASKNLLDLEKQIQGYSLAIAHNSARSIELQYLLETLQNHADGLGQADVKKPLSENDRWSLWQPVAQANLGSVWEDLAEDFPSPQASFGDFLPWIDRSSMSIESEIQSLQAQKEKLVSQKSELTVLYDQMADLSLGLSPMLEVDKVTSDLPQFSVIRPTSTLILIGSLIGLICWFGYWLAVYSLPAKK